MGDTICSGFDEVYQSQLMDIEGGIEIFGCSLGGLASGTLSGAAVGATIGGVPGFIVGAIVCAGVTYAYDQL